MKGRSADSADQQPARPGFDSGSPSSSHDTNDAPGAIQIPKYGDHDDNRTHSRDGKDDVSFGSSSPALALEKAIFKQSAFPTVVDETDSNRKGAREQPTAVTRHVGRLWSISFISLVMASLGMLALSAIVHSFISQPIDTTGCRMSYMRPSYIRFTDFDTEHTPFASKYSLYLYRELGIDDESRVSPPPFAFA